MSIRNDITNNIVEVLKDTTDPKPIFVTREPIDLENLSRQQFPAVVVTTGDEIRSEFTLQGPAGQRSSILNVLCQCYVTGGQLDLQRNDICERVEEALEADRSRDDKALDTKLVNVVVDDTIDKRFGLITLTFEIQYIYTRGAA